MRKRIIIDVSVTDEQKLRDVASRRMAESGFDPDPAIHRDLDIGELVYQALVGSNPDPVCPNEMGLEIVSNSYD